MSMPEGAPSVIFGSTQPLISGKTSLWSYSPTHVLWPWATVSDIGWRPRIWRFPRWLWLQADTTDMNHFTCCFVTNSFSVVSTNAQTDVNTLNLSIEWIEILGKWPSQDLWFLLCFCSLIWDGGVQIDYLEITSNIVIKNMNVTIEKRAYL